MLILQQNRLRWYGHVLRKEDTDWVKKCMEYEVEGSSQSDFFESIDNHVGIDFVKETRSAVCYVGFLCDPCPLLWSPM